MPDPEKVKNETVDANKVMTCQAVALGWNEAGDFMTVLSGIDVFKGIALLEHAKIQLLAQVPPGGGGQAPKIALVPGMPGLSGNGRRG